MHTDKCQHVHINKARQTTKKQTEKEIILQVRPHAVSKKSRLKASTQQQRSYLILNNTKFSQCDSAHSTKEAVLFKR